MNVVPLVDVARVVSGGTPKTSVPEYWDGNVLWATPKDLSNLEAVEINSTPRKLTVAGLQACSAEVLPPNSVLFSSRAPIGLIAVNTQPMATNQGFKSFIPNAQRLEARYLYRWLEFKREWLQSLGVGATFKEVSKATVSRIELPLPPLEEQRRIAAILDKADDLRTKRSQALAHLDILTQSIFHTMFSDIPATTTLGELCRNRFRNGVSPSTRGSVQQKVLTLSAVTGSSFDPTAVKSSTFDKPIPDSNRVSSRLLLICRGNGNRALVGKGYFPRVDVADVGFPDTVIAGEPRIDVVEPLFLEVAWGLPAVRAQLEAAAKTTNGTFKINQTSLAAIELPLPPLELQQTFASRVAAVERLKESHRKHLAELDTLFASLQHRAFKGAL